MVLCLVVYFYYRVAFFVFLFTLVSSFDWLGYSPILVKPIKLYVADGILLFMLALIARVLTRKVRISQLRTPITGLLVLNFLYGFVAIAWGLIVGHEPNNVLGDFRRIFLYPLSVLIALSCFSSEADFRRAIKFFGVALLPIIGTAWDRVVTRQSWEPEAFTPVGDFRAIGYFTGVIVIMGTGVFYGFGMERTKYRIFLLMLVGLLLGSALVSGYRLLWITAIVTVVFVSYWALGTRKYTVRALRNFVLVAFFFVSLILLVQTFFPDLYRVFIEKFYERVLGFDFRGDLRFYAWATAWRKFINAPLLGVGIGDQFTVWAVNSMGQPHLFEITTHNVLLSVLYQTGLVGGGLFLMIHGTVVYYLWKKLKRIDPRFRVGIAGAFAGYLAALSMGMLQPLFETPGAVVITYVWVGMLLRAIAVYRVDNHRIEFTRTS
jgi:O-antigen ligase